MRLIGLTGGIGTGKSTVSNYLASKGCIIIDADKISRELTGPNGEVLPQIRATFGHSVFNLDGTLNRKHLGKIVFFDFEKKKQLEEIVTKVVIDKIDCKIKELKSENYEGVVVIDAPLLFECGLHSGIEETWLITTQLDIRIARIKNRDNLTDEEIIRRINSQMSDVDKAKLATHIIDNSSNLEDLYNKIDKVLEGI